jgi:hypothetical protein
MSVRNAFRDKFLSSLALDDGVTSDPNWIGIAFGGRSELMRSILDAAELTPALEDTLLAVSTAHIGQRTGRPDLVHESLKLYTKGLAEIRRDILNPATRKNDQNLAACLASLLYEVRVSPAGTQDAYMAHYRGSLELLRIRGPHAHTSGIAHSVFKVLRVHAVSLGCPRSDMLRQPNHVSHIPGFQQRCKACKDIPGRTRMAANPMVCIAG